MDAPQTRLAIVRRPAEAGAARAGNGHVARVGQNGRGGRRTAARRAEAWPSVSGLSGPASVASSSPPHTCPDPHAEAVQWCVLALVSACVPRTARQSSDGAALPQAACREEFVTKGWCHVSIPGARKAKKKIEGPTRWGAKYITRAMPRKHAQAPRFAEPALFAAVVVPCGGRRRGAYVAAIRDQSLLCGRSGRAHRQSAAEPRPEFLPRHTIAAMRDEAEALLESDQAFLSTDSHTVCCAGPAGAAGAATRARRNADHATAGASHGCVFERAQCELAPRCEPTTRLSVHVCSNSRGLVSWHAAQHGFFLVVHVPWGALWVE